MHIAQITALGVLKSRTSGVGELQGEGREIEWGLVGRIVPEPGSLQDHSLLAQQQQLQQQKFISADTLRFQQQVCSSWRTETWHAHEETGPWLVTQVDRRFIPLKMGRNLRRLRQLDWVVIWLVLYAILKRSDSAVSALSCTYVIIVMSPVGQKKPQTHAWWDLPRSPSRRRGFHWLLKQVQIKCLKDKQRHNKCCDSNDAHMSRITMQPGCLHTFLSFSWTFCLREHLLACWLSWQPGRGFVSGGMRSANRRGGHLQQHASQGPRHPPFSLLQHACYFIKHVKHASGGSFPQVKIRSQTFLLCQW